MCAGPHLNWYVEIYAKSNPFSHVTHGGGLEMIRHNEDCATLVTSGLDKGLKSFKNC